MNQHYQHAAHLLNERRSEVYPTFAYSVLEHYIRGQVYMDSSHEAALIGTEFGIFVVAGEPKNNELHHTCLEIFHNRKKANKRFTLFSPSSAWNQTIKQLFGKEVRKLKRYSFQFNPHTFSTFLGEKTIYNHPTGRIDEAIINQSTEFNESYINEYWGSPSNYIKNGFGFCLIHNGEIASECISIFSSTDYAEMDIATAAKFRGQGFAAVVATAFIKHCQHHRIQPRWDCDVENRASIKLAEQLGFENPTEYSIFVRS
ncbi:GNAT family N-acetyltransferase [Metabacillus iocasae]|uniref:GNAT superfamily N-acetyltransferase n=1 Tax=Priestia iocasae TaxID=2291674 RepID=A0ABS2QVB4_9BACI|nr:GNAT family N-acetyltransferase [Metabacillus iocasae]MBM7702882.1 GNAT superfamily N-acetyltransferase [Metabacillus iocasae]